MEASGLSGENVAECFNMVVKNLMEQIENGKNKLIKEIKMKRNFFLLIH